MDLENMDQSLCVPVVCGEIQNNKANFALYNDTDIDFDSFYYDIGGYNDSIDFFPLDQYTCWVNTDTLNISYFVAKGKINNQDYTSDTLWMQENARAYTSGTFVLEIYKVESSNKLEFQFEDDYQGECKDL
ncbi:hypothetical protein [Marivirga arenosa]|uniref:Uncharacterized protein n=1 Tax=Marivirga arenosa TaxID=3059076 RepID=A0AA49JCN1_9BACT|nr:hypothetical protein [Marivirga sp. BKB1-2]WKK80909.2 hypothetical protein QYS47_00330 [Marivirga sp. BKB1-2]